MARIRRAAQSAPQEVLVPEAEQPYAVPENWRWVRLGKVVNVSQNKTNVFCPDTKYVGLEHIAKHLGVVSFGTASEIKSVKSIFKKGDILYGKLRPYLNKHDVADFSGVCSTDIIVLQAKAFVDREFVNYFFDLNIFIEYATSHCRGINLPRVSTGVVLDACFPLPPRAEQERIVARIESLFARLDKAREKVDAVLGRCAARKAALLHKAFSGELTAAWRKARGIGLESWEEKLSGQLFSYVTSGSRGWAKYYSEEGALFIRMGNLSHETIELNLSEVQHVKLPDDIAKDHSIRVFMGNHSVYKENYTAEERELDHVVRRLDRQIDYLIESYNIDVITLQPIDVLIEEYNEMYTLYMNESAIDVLANLAKKAIEIIVSLWKGLISVVKYVIQSIKEFIFGPEKSGNSDAKLSKPVEMAVITVSNGKPEVVTKSISSPKEAKDLAVDSSKKIESLVKSMSDKETAEIKKIQDAIDSGKTKVKDKNGKEVTSESYIGEVKYINDDGEDVPKVCPECGADVKVYLKGEPVFVCSNKNCSKYFGTVPFKEDGFDPFGFKKRREERERLAKIAKEKMKKYDSAYKSHLPNIAKICANKVEYMTITDSISFESMYGAYVANIATFVLTNDMDNEFAEKYGYGSAKHIKATNGLLMNAEKKMKTLATKVDDYISKHDLPGRAISRAHDDYVVIEIEIPYENTSVTEAKLTSEQRAKLKDSDYGIPSKKKYPMPDESHVRSAIQMFNHVSSEDEAELAKNIKKKIKQYGMSVDVGKENRFSKYYTSSNETATIQNAIREYATGNKGYPDITLKEATDFNKILDDFKASNDEHKESKLKMLVNKLYSKNVDNIVDGTPSLLSYIRTFFIIGTFAVPVVGPVIGIVAFIADRIVALHMDRENTLKMRAAFQKEIRATDKKIDSTKDSEKRSRLEEYRKSLMDAYDKIDEYYSDLLSEKEMDEKFENPDDDDIRMRSSGSMSGDDFSDFDFGDDLNDFDDDDDFENMDEASRYIVYTSKLANILEFQCIHKTFNQEACRVMISKYPSFIKELADVAIKFPTIIDPRDLRRSIDDIRSDAKINNMHIGVIEKYDLDNAYNDLDRAIDNQKATRPRDITFESYKLGVAIEITRTLNEVYSSCMYYSPIMEASFMNTIKLASEKLKQSFQKLSDKEKTISRNLDVSVNNFAKAAEKSMTDDNREAILKGSVLPKASKIVKLAIANIGIGVLIDPVVAVIGTLGYLGVSAHMKNKQKRAILDEIEVELKMCQKYIDLAESKNDLKSLKKLYTIQRSLERQKAKIMYNLKTKGESYHTTEELGNKY